MRDIAINRIMTPGPATIGPGDPVLRAKEMLGSEKLHHLPVVDDGKLVGIVSSSDLFKFYLMDDGGQTLTGVTVRNIMQSDPVSIVSDASLRDAALKLSIGGFHALPVVEPDGMLVGIVTSSDLINQLLHQLPEGDGSIRPDGENASPAGLSENEITAVIHEAERQAKAGTAHAAAQVVLHFRDRNRTLLAVCQAAELYMRSGHGEHEHSVLMKRLADARRAVERTNLQL